MPSGFTEISEVFSKAGKHECVALSCGHICQIPGVVRDECCQCSGSKRLCYHCNRGAHAHTFSMNRAYCNKHDVPVGRDKSGECCICSYKEHVDKSTTSFKDLKLYQKSPWLKNSGETSKWAKLSVRKKKIMWRTAFPNCQCDFHHIAVTIKGAGKDPNTWSSRHHKPLQQCPHGGERSATKVSKPKPQIKTLNFVHEFAELANDKVALLRERNFANVNLNVNSAARTTDEQVNMVCAEFNGENITWPALEKVKNAERSIHDWVVFQNKDVERPEEDDDTFSIITESFSDSCWVDLAPKRRRKQKTSFAEILKRKRKGNFLNKTKVKTDPTQYDRVKCDRHNSTIRPSADAEMMEFNEEQFYEPMKGAYRNHATKNSRKGFSRVKKFNMRGRKRCKHSVRRTCKKR